MNVATALGAVEAASQERDMTDRNKENMAGRSAAERIAVLVLGMHRSGTSALTRVLSLLGCDLPKTLMGASRANETGHWESLAIVELNDEILSSAGSNWQDWLAFNPGWQSSPKAAEFKQRALAALEEEFGQSHLFVLKDPRICRFTPFWLDVLNAAGVRPAIVMPVRNPLEVAASLSTRDGMDPALGHLLWLRHLLEAEAGSRGLPRFHTSFEALLAGWPPLALGAQEKLGVTWPRLSQRAGEEIEAFLLDRLRHHTERPKRVLDNPLLSGWLKDSFAIFSRWAVEGEQSEDYAVLDRIRGELDISGPAFARLISGGQQAAQRAKALDASLKAAQEKLVEAEAATAAHQTSVEALQGQLEETRLALSAAQDSFTQSEAERLAELERLRGELSHLQSELAQRRAEADDATSQLNQAEQRFRAELEAAEQRLVAAEREGQHIGAEIKKVIKEKAAIENRLAERFNETAIMTRLLAEREGMVQASNQQLAWLREVSAILLNGSDSRTLKGRLAALLPAPVRLRKQHAQMQSMGIFDPDAYLAANPDVAEAGVDPLRHYIDHGMGEQRPLQPVQQTGDGKGSHDKR